MNVILNMNRKNKMDYLKKLKLKCVFLVPFSYRYLNIRLRPIALKFKCSEQCNWAINVS